MNVRHTLAQVDIGPPFDSAPDEPTLHFTVATTPGNSTGGEISQQAARRLIRELRLALEEIEERK